MSPLLPRNPQASTKAEALPKHRAGHLRSEDAPSGSTGAAYGIAFYLLARCLTKTALVLLHPGLSGYIGTRRDAGEVRQLMNRTTLRILNFDAGMRQGQPGCTVKFNERLLVRRHGRDKVRFRLRQITLRLQHQIAG